MMSLQRNYYEVLGLPPGASTDQIKKKYRELARKFHPDVVQDKALGQRVFTQINQAYSVLGNPERRAQYNDSLQHGTAQSTPESTSTAASASKTAAPAPSAAAVKPSAAAVKPSAAAVKPEAAPQPAPSRAAANPQAFADMLGRAENAIMAGKPVEARAFCVRILEADPRQVRALEILGDALAQMGKPDEAADQYRKALQVSPSSLIQAKLNRIAPSAPSGRPAAPQAAPIRNGNGAPPKNGTAPANGSGAQKTIPPSASSEETEKSGGLLGRLLGRK